LQIAQYSISKVQDFVYLQEILAEKEGVIVSRPCQTTQVRVRDLSDATEEQDVLLAIASARDCNHNIIKVRPIRSSGRSLGTAWAMSSGRVQ